MKTCEQFLPDLCAWIDGELEDSRALEAHLAECASCRALADQYRRIDAALADVEPPAQLHAHIMQGVTEAHSPKAKRRFAFGSATAVAAVAAALLLAVGSGRISLPHWNSSASQAADTAALAVASEAAAPMDSAPLESAMAADEDIASESLKIDHGASFTLGPDETATGADSDGEVPESAAAEVPAEEAPTLNSSASDTLIGNAAADSSADTESVFSGSEVNIDRSLETNTAVRRPEQAFASASSSLSWHITLPDTMDWAAEFPQFSEYETLVLDDGGQECFVILVTLEQLEELYNFYYADVGGELYEVTADTSSVAIYFTDTTN